SLKQKWPIRQWCHWFGDPWRRCPWRKNPLGNTKLIIGQHPNIGPRLVTGTNSGPFSKSVRRQAPDGPLRAPAVSGAASYPCCFKEDVAMRTFDFPPFALNAIGFETLFDRLNDRSNDNSENYPPYDIVRKGEDAFEIN